MGLEREHVDHSALVGQLFDGIFLERIGDLAERWSAAIRWAAESDKEGVDRLDRTIYRAASFRGMNNRAVVIVMMGAVSVVSGLERPKYHGPCERPSLLSCPAPIQDDGRRELLSSTLAQNGIAGNLSTSSASDARPVALATSTGSGRVRLGDVFTLHGK